MTNYEQSTEQVAVHDRPLRPLTIPKPRRALLTLPKTKHRYAMRACKRNAKGSCKRLDHEDIAKDNLER